MAQYETTGSGYIDSGDRRIERKVIVSTDGTIEVPTASSGWPLSNISVSNEAGGLRRGVFEFSQGGEGGASYNQYGKRIELTGGTREVPIYNHPYFSTLSTEAIQEVQNAAENKNALPLPTTETQKKLYSFLTRRVEYFLSPAVVARISEIETTLPSLEGIAKVANPPELKESRGTFWVTTAITASPIGTAYEVTREYTLNYSSWEDVEFLYNQWDPNYSEE